MFLLIQDYLIAIGALNHNKMELLSRSNIWLEQLDYPYGTEYSNIHLNLLTRSFELKIFRQAENISKYSIIALKNVFYIFGGYVRVNQYTGTTTVASFSTITKEWKKLGDLKEARMEHQVFVHQGDFVIVGGKFEAYISTEISTERCTLKNSTIRCTSIEPKLKSSNKPVVMSIPYDYCQK